MHRFYLPPAEARKSPLTLGRSEAHHALHVLRLRQGDRATVLDGAGGEYLCLVQTAKKDCVELSLLEKKEHPKPQWQITLLQAIPKGKLIETIIQKATELGVSRVVPLLSERVVVKLDEKEAQKKAAAWQAVAIEAIKQCGAPFLTQIWAPLSITDFLARKEVPELALVGCLEPGSKHPRAWFEQFRAGHPRNPASISVWIGPEGDFTPDEYKIIKGSGVLPITLGPLILRTDTAAAYCLSILNYELTADLKTDH